jgi:hypothetical protein
MANEEHLKILKQGPAAWNQWRESHSRIQPDFGPDFCTKPGGADLRGFHLSGANLSGAYLLSANLSGANLRLTNLRGVKLMGANLTSTDLNEADLTGANLTRTDLQDAELTGANLTNGVMETTILVNVDLSDVRGLKTIRHFGPSTLSIDTIYRSKGKIPEVFLRGCGVPDNLIMYMRSLTAAALEYYSCFISYSSKDQEFADRLHLDLQRNGIRCWFAPKDLPIGSEIRSGIDDAIRLHDKLLVVLSQNSVQSSWVKKEVETAFDKESHENRFALFPIRLDDTVMNTSTAWAADIRRMRNIGDFSNWKNDDSYRNAFKRLLRDLRAEPKSKAAPE